MTEKIFEEEINNLLKKLYKKQFPKKKPYVN
jgi:hypothetical protein